MKKENIKIEIRNESKSKLENVDVNANILRSNIVESRASSEYSSQPFSSSFVSHWNPHLTESYQRPSSISSMVTHCATSPPLGSSFSSLAMSEVLEALNKAVEKLSESMTRWGSSRMVSLPQRYNYIFIYMRQYFSFFRNSIPKRIRRTKRVYVS